MSFSRTLKYAPTHAMLLTLFVLCPTQAQSIQSQEPTPAVADDVNASLSSFTYATTLPGEDEEGYDSYCDPCSGRLGLLGGWIKPSDQCFSDFISPMTNPVFFEDPRTLTEARAIFIQHKVPLAALGGDVQLFAVQLRAALSDRLSLIATKDGFFTSTHPVVGDGWADVNVGLKYNLLANYEAHRLLSVGATYEMSVGSSRALQGNGDGEAHLFTTAGTKLGCNGHWVSAVGARLPVDSSEESTSMYWSNHFDQRLGRIFYVFSEVNWYHWLKSGDTALLPTLEGLDLFNRGAAAVTGNDIVTGAVGLKVKPADRMEIGVAWEVPLTDRRDILENRLTADVILRY